MKYMHLLLKIFASCIYTFLQIVCCAKCRYKYELVSGNIVSVDSEEIRLVCFCIFYFLGCLTFPQLVLTCHGI